MQQPSAAGHAVVSIKQREALEAVMTAANLQEFDGTLWMPCTQLTDPASLCKLGSLISAWAFVYHADTRIDTVCATHNGVAHGALETDYSPIPYHHSHDETL